MKPRFEMDRYLRRRGGSWVYYRRVPSKLAGLDQRHPVIRHALGTRDLAVARKARDLLQLADDELWASLLMGDGVDSSRGKHAAAVKRVEAMGFGYMPIEKLAQSRWDELSSRMEAIMPISTPPEVHEALLGVVEQPKDRFADALRIYIEGPGKDALKDKSANQLRIWKNIPKRAIKRFVEVVEDKPLVDITRADAVQFFRYWLARIIPDDDETEPMHPSSGNREIGELRKLYREYFTFLHHDTTRQNPFSGLGFDDDESARRPSFSNEWMAKSFLTYGPLAGLNAEARGILLAMIETGCRPSEICALTPSAIVLEDEVPHLRIQPRKARNRSNSEVREFGPNQVKSFASIRSIPLVGVSLEVFKKFPEGFPRYREKPGSACQTINSYLDENGLAETERHTLYSIRHAFEDRMKRAEIDYEVRQGLFGHAIPRQKYGDDGGLVWRRDLLHKMKLSYDANLLSIKSPNAS